MTPENWQARSEPTVLLDGRAKHYVEVVSFLILVTGIYILEVKSPNKIMYLPFLNTVLWIFKE